MPANSIIQALTKMTALQKSLTVIAKEKTEIVKKGDMNTLQSLIRDENKHIQAIKKMEALLIRETKSFLLEKGVSVENPTLAQAIEAAQGGEKDKLIEQKNILKQQIEELNRQNQLNQQLLEQSLQFVQMSLDLLQPDLETYNYDRSDNSQQVKMQPGRSIFDSKA